MNGGKPHQRCWFVLMDMAVCSQAAAGRCHGPQPGVCTTVLCARLPLRRLDRYLGSPIFQQETRQSHRGNRAFRSCARCAKPRRGPLSVSWWTLWASSAPTGCCTEVMVRPKKERARVAWVAQPHCGLATIAQMPQPQKQPEHRRPHQRPPNIRAATHAAPT